MQCFQGWHGGVEDLQFVVVSLRLPLLSIFVLFGLASRAGSFISCSQVKTPVPVLSVSRRHTETAQTVRVRDFVRFEETQRGRVRERESKRERVGERVSVRERV